ncbi:MAG TPA: hypothetical protein VFN78_08585 [Ktedonobacterales bacterium]|nr:hypothetical protein [Ktedonobacterales bacterium]
MRNGARSVSDVDRRWLGDALYRAIPQLHSGAWEAISCEVAQVRARWSSQVVFCRLTYRELGAANPLTRRLVVKSGPHVRDGVEVEALGALARAGMRSPARFQVPQLLGALPEEGVMAQGEASGTTLRALVANPQAPVARVASAAQATARWLARLQSLQLPGAQTRSLRAEPGEPVERLIADLRLAVPRHDALSGILDRLPTLCPTSEGRPTPSHGDFHPGQALVGPRLTMTVVDFETFAWRAPGFDAGTCLAQLLAMSWFDGGGVRPGVMAARAFWQTYAREGAATWPEARYHTMRALLQVLRFALASPRPDAGELRALWAWLIEGFLSSETDDDLWNWLDSGRPVHLHSVTEAAETARALWW